MKLSAKERIMVVVLILVTIWGIGIALVLIPTYESVEKRREALLDVQNELTLTNAKLLENASLDGRISEAYQMAAQDIAIFNDYMREHDIDMMLTALFARHNVAISSISISQLALEEIVKYQPVYIDLSNNFSKRHSASSQNSGGSTEPGEMIATSTVFISYKGKYSNVKELINEINSLNKAIYIDKGSLQYINFEARDDSRNGDLRAEGELNLKVYCISGIAEPRY